MPIVSRLLTAGMSAVLLYGQTPSVQAPSADPPVLRSTTRLVQLNVVAHDRKGEPVTDLKKEDFEVFEKGKRQQISVFSLESRDKLSQPPTKMPVNVFSNRLEQQTGVPSSVTVILLDSLNTTWTDQAYARRQVIQFLKQIEPSDHVALYSLGRQLRVLYDYTRDASELVARLQKVNGDLLPDLSSSQLGQVLPDGSGASGLNSNYDPLADQTSVMEAAFFTTSRVQNTCRALEVIAQHLSNLPGRKSLIWVSSGFPLTFGFDYLDNNGSMPSAMRQEQRTYHDEIERAMRALNAASLAVYPVDARGLTMGVTFQDASRSGFTLPGSGGARYTGAAVPNQDTMQLIADRTGGRAFYNTNDLQGAVRRALEDSRVTYNLGYYPSEVSLDGKFHDIKIKVNRPGVSVRARKGYFAMREPENDPKKRQQELNDAVWSPLDGTAIGVNARVDLVDEPSPNILNVVVQIDPTSVVIEPKADRWNATLDVLFIQKDQQGKTFGGVTDTLDMKLVKANYLKVLNSGFMYRKQFARNPQAVLLRIVVRDHATGAVGSLSVPIKQVAKWDASKGAPATP